MLLGNTSKYSWAVRFYIRGRRRTTPGWLNKSYRTNMSRSPNPYAYVKGYIRGFYHPLRWPIP